MYCHNFLFYTSFIFHSLRIIRMRGMHITTFINIFILVFNSFSSSGSSAASPVFSVYPVRGLDPSPFYSFRVRKVQTGQNHADTQWMGTFAMQVISLNQPECEHSSNVQC